MGEEEEAEVSGALEVAAPQRRQLLGGEAIAYLLIDRADRRLLVQRPRGQFSYTWSGFSTDAWTNVFGVELTVRS